MGILSTVLALGIHLTPVSVVGDVPVRNMHLGEGSIKLKEVSNTGIRYVMPVIDLKTGKICDCGSFKDIYAFAQDVSKGVEMAITKEEAMVVLNAIMKPDKNPYNLTQGDIEEAKLIIKKFYTAGEDGKVGIPSFAEFAAQGLIHLWGIDRVIPVMRNDQLIKMKNGQYKAEATYWGVAEEAWVRQEALKRATKLEIKEYVAMKRNPSTKKEDLEEKEVDILANNLNSRYFLALSLNNYMLRLQVTKDDFSKMGLDTKYSYEQWRQLAVDGVEKVKASYGLQQNQILDLDELAHWKYTVENGTDYESIFQKIEGKRQ